MSRVFTEVAANANFATGVTCPTGGEAGTQWWNEYEALFQQLADREQALRQFVGATAAGAIVRAFPLVPVVSTGANYTVALASNALWMYQHVLGQSVFFDLLGMPVGAKLVSVTVRLAGGNPMGLPIATHAALPATMPQIKLWSQTDGTGTQIGSTAVDASTPVASYNAMHSITVTANHTILTATNYRLELDGENGANAVIDGMQVAQVYATIQPV